MLSCPDTVHDIPVPFFVIIKCPIAFLFKNLNIFHGITFKINFWLIIIIQSQEPEPYVSLKVINSRRLLVFFLLSFFVNKIEFSLLF